ncbi:PREDICTED: IQ domain-containing protein D [Mesitornis unicolor]|uniref:IQ domain-containing protein D n=1 Tax=Mesitornis unicolor TaxID=54374 RepID=UPI000528087D|nr:PREDICTED: IQ domain-containing protein D [Mesitornis unicolor]
MASPENVMKMSEPRQLKPGSIERERIKNILDEVIAKLELSSLIPQMLDSLDRFADMLGPEVTNKLIEHQKLSNEMKRLLSSSEEEDTMRAEEQRGRLCLLEQRVKRSVTSVLRLLLANPSLCQALKREAWVRNPPAEVVIKAFGDFRNFMLERLLASPVEQEEKIPLMEDISLQTENTETATALQAELAAAIRTQEEEIHKRDEVIKDLKTCMQDLTEECKASIQQIKEQGEKQQKEELRASQARCAKLQQDIEQLRAQLDASVLEHRASELALRKGNCRKETELWNLVQEYDTDMAEKQAQYEEIHAAYTEEKAQLALLTEKHAVLLQEYSKIEEEQKKAALKELAATRIQAFWRGYLVRLLFKPKKKEGKGKKSKKLSRF